MNIDNHYLDDSAIARISAQHPSTNWGAELMRDAWPKRYPGLLSSETYRGCAIVLSMLRAHMHRGISVREIQQVVEGVNQSLQGSRTFQAPSDVCGGANLTVVNAWTTASDLGFTAEQIAAAYESEMIYAARMFVRARQQGI